jgi:hypothetical protein
VKRIVLAALFGAACGGLVGAFVLGLPDVGLSVVATLVGTALGGYAGAVVGSLFVVDAA